MRLFLAMVAWCTAVPWALQVLRLTIASRHRLPEDPLWVVGGLLVGVFFICWRRPNGLVQTLVHEGCHLLACTFLLVPVHRVTASSGRGGMVEHDHTGWLRSALIALAPYVLPLLLAPLLFARVLTPEGLAREILAAACAAAYPSYLTAIFHNIRLNFWDRQGDLAKVGRLLSLAIILAAALLVTSWAIVVLWDGSWDLHRLGRFFAPDVAPEPGRGPER